MNILPLVLGCLIILTIFSSTFFNQQIKTRWEEKSLYSHFKAQRHAQAKTERKLYEKEEEKAVSSRKKSAKTTGAYSSRRERSASNSFSMLNLAPLFDPQKPASPFLYEAAAELLRLLYPQGHKGFEYQFLDAWTSIAKKEKVESLAGLYPENPQLGALFYKMLKGTKKWDFETHSGIPPLEEFFCIDPKATKPIYFHFASKPLLTALFSQPIASEILELEKKKWEEDKKHHTLTKDQLSLFLSQRHGSKVALIDMEEYLDFSKRRSTLKNVIGLDKKTGISVKKKL